ncbi:DDE-type integrase/transposase/recombinase [Deinococcus oregonensis]|uniref:DDE-type integrase/transposase/recombinase n=1 Tax=Deinococcus oregonensis TaxID=1805970 RepID=A0ABV6ASF2_9DEIO
MSSFCGASSRAFSEELRQCDLNEVCTTVDGVRHGSWRAVDEHETVLDIPLQRHRNPEAAKTLLIRLLGEDDVTAVIHTDQLLSSGAAIQESSSLTDVEQQQMVSTARCNNTTLHSHRPT